MLSQQSEPTWEHFPTENQRLVYQGRELTDNNILLKDIPRMANAPGAVFNMSRQPANTQRQQVNLPPVELNEVTQHLNRVKTLQRDFHECIIGAQLNRNANKVSNHLRSATVRTRCLLLPLIASLLPQCASSNLTECVPLTSQLNLPGHFDLQASNKIAQIQQELSAWYDLNRICFEHENNDFEFETLLGKSFPEDRQYGPIRSARVLCDIRNQQSIIPVKFLWQMRASDWSKSGDKDDQMAMNRETTSYYVNAVLTPIPVGYDAWTATRNIEMRDAVVSLDSNMDFIILGSNDLNRLNFFWESNIFGFLTVGPGQMEH